MEGFAPIEKQAYWGWLALHGWGKPLEKREEALLAFRDAGGFGTLEAAALFDLLEGNPARVSNSSISSTKRAGSCAYEISSLGVLQAGLLPAGSP